MSPEAIRSRLRVVRSIFAWVVIGAIAFIAWVYNLTILSLILAALVVVLVIYRIAREASTARTLARADQTRIDQTSAGSKAGFTTVSVGGIVLQILIVLAVDAFIAVAVHSAPHFTAGSGILVAIAVILAVFVIIVAALTFRLRGQQRSGMATLEAKAAPSA